MSATFILELRDKRAKLITAANEITVAAAKDKRSMTAEEAEKWDKIHGETETIAKDIDRLEKQEAANRSVSNPAGNRIIADGGDPAPADAKKEAEHRSKAMSAFLRFGMADLPPEQRQVLAALRADVTPEMRAQSVGTTTAGGYTVAPDTSLYSSIDKALQQFGWFDAAGVNVLRTATGANLPMPTSTDVSNSGALLAENTQATTQDITIGQVSLDSYMYTSKIVLVSLQLLQDAAINVDGFVGEALGERLGRAFATAGTTGTGSSQPNGIVTAATLGKTAAGAAAITYAELLDLKHSVDPAYRKNAKWMFKDSTLLLIKKLVDGSSRPLWQPGISSGIAATNADTIDSDPYVINQDMPAATTGLKSVLYGDFSRFAIRYSGPTTLLRLTERYADYLQVGFLAFQRFDSELLSAGAPIKYLIQA